MAGGGQGRVRGAREACRSRRGRTGRTSGRIRDTGGKARSEGGGGPPGAHLQRRRRRGGAGGERARIRGRRRGGGSRRKVFLQEVRFGLEEIGFIHDRRTDSAACSQYRGERHLTLQRGTPFRGNERLPPRRFSVTRRGKIGRASCRERVCQYV